MSSVEKNEGSSKSRKGALQEAGLARGTNLEEDGGAELSIWDREIRQRRRDGAEGWTGRGNPGPYDLGERVAGSGPRSWNLIWRRRSGMETRVPEG